MIKCKTFNGDVESLNGEQLYDLLVQYYHNKVRITEVLIDGKNLDLWKLKESIKW